MENKVRRTVLLSRSVIPYCEDLFLLTCATAVWKLRQKYNTADVRGDRGCNLLKVGLPFAKRKVLAVSMNGSIGFISAHHLGIMRVEQYVRV